MTDERKKAGQMYDIARAELTKWPYSTFSIEQTLDHELIQGRAKQHLFQALRNRNLVAFIGSGLSAAYGRPGWTEWRGGRTKANNDAAEAFLSTAEHSIKLIEAIIKLASNLESEGYSEKDRGNALTFLKIKKSEIHFHSNDVRKLSETFKHLSAEGPFPGGDQNPILFQVSAQLHAILLKNRELFLDAERAEHISEHKKTNIPVKDLPLPAQSAIFGFNQNTERHPAPHFLPAYLEELILGLDAKMSKDFEKTWKQFLESIVKLCEEISDTSSNQSLDHITKDIMVDETAQAEAILKRATYYTEKSGREKWEHARKNDITNRNNDDLRRRSRNKSGNLHRNVKGIRELPGRYWSLGFFKTDSYEILREHIESSDSLGSLNAAEKNTWAHLNRILKDELAENKSRTWGRLRPVERTIISPSHRYILEMMLLLLEDPLSGNLLSMPPDNQTDSSPIEGSIYHPVKPEDFASRLSLIEEDLDPLNKIVLDLGIRQFLTTNYDLEIERLFQDRGYRGFTDGSSGGARGNLPEHPSSDSFRVDELGGVLRDFSFHREKAPDLVTFAVDQDGSDASVFHLHGRATEESSLVITERDYMDQYLRVDGYRDIVDEGIRVAFSANPILFLGLGMTEADLLHPFRQFMSNRDRLWRAHSIALLPANTSRADRTKKSATLYMRYGVQSIFYGDAFIEKIHAEGSAKYIRVDWMHFVTQLIKILDDKNDQLIKWITHYLSGKDNDSLPEIFSIEPQKRLEEIEQKLADQVDPNNVYRASLGTTLLDALFEEDGSEENDRSQSDGSIPHRRLRDCYFDADLPFSHPTHRGSNAVNPSLLLEQRLIGNFLGHTINAGHSIWSQRDRCNEELRALLRQCNSVKAGLNGARSAISTAVLSITLDKLEEESQAWWKFWQRSPPHRIPSLTNPRSNDQGDRVRVRHMLENTITKVPIERGADEIKSLLHDSDQTEPPPVQEITGVRSFDTFLDAISARFDVDRGNRDIGTGRRFYCVAAHRGLGKGSFLTTFYSETGLKAYKETAWKKDFEAQIPSAGKPNIRTFSKENIHFRTSIFLNLSFSTEIASTFDMVISELLNIIPSVSAQGAKQRKEVENQLLRTIKQNSRQEQLEFLLEKFHEVSLEKQDSDEPRLNRFLLCISAVELMHYPGGMAKNREVREFLELFAGPRFRHVPFDFIIITSEENISEVISGSGPLPAGMGEGEFNERYSLTLIPIVRRGITREGLENIQRRESASKLNFGRFFTAGLPGKSRGSIEVPLRQSKDRYPEEQSTDDVCFMHFARVMRPERLLIDNFRPLAMMLYAKFAQGVLSFIREGIDFKSFEQEHFKIESYRSRLTNDDLWADLLFKFVYEQIETLPCDYGTELGIWTSAEKPAAMNGAIADHVPRIPSSRQILINRYRNNEQEIALASNREWRDIRGVLRGNRYCITIMLAAAERIALSARDILTGADLAEKFIRDTIEHVKSVSDSRGEEAVLHDVLDAYEQFHKIGDPRFDVELHLLILRHLAVIGTPTSTDVLVRVPEIRWYFDRLVENQNERRSTQLKNALDDMAERGLVFRLGAHSGMNEGSGDQEYKPSDGEIEHRYALHRLMQRHIISKMGSGPQEFAEVNSFAPSLYASMPADLPRPDYNSYRFLKELVEALSQYPDKPAGFDSAINLHYSEAQNNTQVQALRAALSIIRSSFSVSVVSRFEDYETEDPYTDLHGRGYFEQYRIQVRWLIRKAWEVIPEESKESAAKSVPEEAAKGEFLAAFYKDEIVWLYNECGIVNLVQGNLLDAIALLRQALRFNSRIEGRYNNGAMHNRISLNLAVTQIERGRIEGARKRLRSICESEARSSSKTGRIWHIAHGYLGLTCHLRGDFEAGQAHYERAIKGLRQYEDHRACSVFCRHLGDLFRARGQFNDARSSLNDSISFAETGGHEDMHKRARLALVRLDIAEAGQNGSQTIVRSALGRLDMIQEYATSMGMPSLMCDASLVRAYLLLEQGETTLSGKLFSEVITLANRNGMSVRLSVALTGYARVLIARGLMDQARKLLMTCLQMAKRCQNQMNIAEVERAFDSLH